MRSTAVCWAPASLAPSSRLFQPAFAHAHRFGDLGIHPHDDFVLLKLVILGQAINLIDQAVLGLGQVERLFLIQPVQFLVHRGLAFGFKFVGAVLELKLVFLGLLILLDVFGELLFLEVRGDLVLHFLKLVKRQLQRGNRLGLRIERVRLLGAVQCCGGHEPSDRMPRR